MITPQAENDGLEVRDCARPAAIHYLCTVGSGPGLITVPAHYKLGEHIRSVFWAESGMTRSGNRIWDNCRSH